MSGISLGVDAKNGAVAIALARDAAGAKFMTIYGPIQSVLFGALAEYFQMRADLAAGMKPSVATAGAVGRLAGSTGAGMGGAWAAGKVAARVTDNPYITGAAALGGSIVAVQTANLTGANNKVGDAVEGWMQGC